jgi:hypothetical protein
VSLRWQASGGPNLNAEIESRGDDVVDRLLDVLREHAASPDEDPKVDARKDWQLDVNSYATRLRAYTKQVWDDPESAWQGAVKLRDAVVALGYDLHSSCEITAESEEEPNFDAPPRLWRGYVSLVFATK